MTKSTQRSITTFAWLAILGSGAYYAVTQILPKLNLGSGDHIGITPAQARQNAANYNPSQTLFEKMMSELKDFQAGGVSYMAYLQGEYRRPGGGSSTSGTGGNQTNVAQFF
jgi:hypothetical protein